MPRVRRRLFPALRTQVTELALGTWGLSGEAYGPVSGAEADAVIDRALALGINVFETADCYGRGDMERRLGQRLRERAHDTVIVTRVGTERTDQGACKNFSAGYLKEAIEASRQRIGRERLDVVLLHNPSVVTVENGEAVDLLRSLKQAGTIGAWGVSAGNREVALAALEAGAEAISLTYNLFYSRDLHAAAADIAMRGVAVLAHSVLAYGLLTSHWGPERTFDQGDHRRERWSAAALRKRVGQLEVVRSMVGGDVMTPRAAALRFVLSNSLVTSAILGPRTTAQLDQLVREAGSGPPYLPDRTLSELSSKLIAAGVHT